MIYDAVIAGASFAGLGVARIMKGNVLLIDRKKIGEGQTSTCCTYLHLLKEVSCEESVLQIIDRVVFHIDSKSFVFDLNFPFATFDYQKFCRLLRKQTNAEFLLAKVSGLKDNGVLTDKGNFKSECVVDATGWGATLGNSIKKNFTGKIGKSFGIETTPALKGKAIEVWLNHKSISKGIFWLFPCLKYSRIGLASYAGETKLKEKLENFLGESGLKLTDNVHGGYFTHKLGKATAGNIFLVGDSAGQCLPLSGEGIRPALYFGQKCGKIIQEIRGGEKKMNEGLKEYEEFVSGHKKYYSFLLNLQRAFCRSPHSLLSLMTKFINQPQIFNKMEKKYVSAWDLAD